MKQVDARWTPKVNLLVVECDCGHIFQHRVDRWKMRCPQCNKTESINALR